MGALVTYYLFIAGLLITFLRCSEASSRTRGEVPAARSDQEMALPAPPTCSWHNFHAAAQDSQCLACLVPPPPPLPHDKTGVTWFALFARFQLTIPSSSKVSQSKSLDKKTHSVTAFYCIQNSQSLLSLSTSVSFQSLFTPASHLRPARVTHMF